MSQTSEWLELNELFELTKEGVMSYLIKEINFISMLDLIRKEISCGHEKRLIGQAKAEFKAILKELTIKKTSIPLSEAKCEDLMKKIHITIKNIIEFTELEFFN